MLTAAMGCAGVQSVNGRRKDGSMNAAWRGKAYVSTTALTGARYKALASHFK